MIWAGGAHDIEGHNSNTDIMTENNRKESKMTAELCATS